VLLIHDTGRVRSVTPRRSDHRLIASAYEQHGRALFAYARSLVADTGVAEDLIHQVFLKLLKGGAVLPETPRPYLFKAIRNAALNHRRRQTREVDISQVGAWLEAPTGREHEALAIEAALASLPDDQREVVVLRIWGGLTFEEVAAVVAAPANTVASRFRYARERLRSVLQPLQQVSHARRS
jgi:RNA polymerase sigma factor (sigma-70 family)